MNTATKIIQSINNVSSYTEKLILLKRYADVKSLRDILHFIYNPYLKTGISEAKMQKIELSRPSTATHLITYDMAISYFKRNNTGSLADMTYAGQFLASVAYTYGDDSAEYDLAKAIITQNLKIGVTAKSLNTAYGAGFIPIVGCMLGTRIDDVGQISWPCIVTEKLDGIRRILIKENGVCRLYSRSGHEDAGLIEIVREAAALPDNTMYDGELLAAGTFVDSIAQRQASNSIANSKGTKTGLTFNVFDMLPLDEFYEGASTSSALQRKLLLGATFGDTGIQCLSENWGEILVAFGTDATFSAIKAVPILGLVSSISEVEPIVEAIWKRGGEGVMLNTADGLYEVKRSKKLIKVKRTEEHVVKVVDVLSGTGKYEYCMGALVVLYKDSIYLGVGSGFTDAERIAIWAHPERYIGRSIEIETFGESTNAAGEKSLNCPIFKRFVGDE